LNGPFSPKLHKKSPKCVSIPGILLFVYTKNYHFKTALHLERQGGVPDTEKSAGILDGLRAFLTQYGAN
jgi:hypothetical protein